MTAPQEKPRHFYRKPHHALSMMLDHGMELMVEHFATKELIPANSAWLAMHVYGKLSGEPVKDVRLFVAPDSLHLLEPRVGCLVEYMGHQGGFGLGTVTDAPYEGEDGEMLFCIDDADSVPVENLHRIIQRNGIAFMWPESEAA